MISHPAPAPPEILLTPAAMARVDRAADASGIDTFGLMVRAGEAVAAAALRHFPGTLRFVVLAGPGNNGGDGYVAASALARAGAPVALYSAVDAATLKGDAARARSACPLPVLPITAFVPRAGDLIVDALFGAGLTRDLPAPVLAVISAVSDLRLPVLAVDLPSGIDGATGSVRGAAFEATRTVTFMTRKPGHVLLPGRLHCGTLEVFDIGIPRRLVEAEAGPLWVNGPAVWSAQRPMSSATDHKYRRGHVTVFSGPPTATGAARLSAQAALKGGAGLVTLASPRDTISTNAAHLTAVMLTEIDEEQQLADWLRDKRRTTFVLGPAFGDLEKARRFAQMVGEAGRRLVLDADGITAFKDGVSHLADVFRGGDTRLVVTPHDGEFARLFPDIAGGTALGKVEKACAAAKTLAGIVVYKGGDTVIASPDGRAAIEACAPSTLATAGSGDVLAGIIAARLAAGMPAFEAACSGVYEHGQAALRAGQGLTAEDLLMHIGAV